MPVPSDEDLIKGAKVALMGVRTKTTKNKIPQIEINLKELDGRKVIVGVSGKENQWLAGIHEFGCNIAVTAKMRAYLHHEGLHLKKSTKYIKIPERSFLRTGFDENSSSVIKKNKAILKLVLGGDIKADLYLKNVGRELSGKIKEYAISLNSPANHPYTVSKKRSSNPLVDTGGMIANITFEVE